MGKGKEGGEERGVEREKGKRRVLKEKKGTGKKMQRRNGEDLMGRVRGSGKKGGWKREGRG